MIQLNNKLIKFKSLPVEPSVKTSKADSLSICKLSDLLLVFLTLNMYQINYLAK